MIGALISAGLSTIGALVGGVQRQKAIDNFIADFYCHKARLIIEIDGSQHFSDEGLQKDEFRTEVLEGYDLKVVRFTNHGHTPCAESGHTCIVG